MLLFQVDSAGNIEIVNVPYNTKFSINDALRKQNGVYTIRAENEHGKDEAEVEITILGKRIFQDECYFVHVSFPER